MYRKVGLGVDPFTMSMVSSASQQYLQAQPGDGSLATQFKDRVPSMESGGTNILMTGGKVISSVIPDSLERAAGNAINWITGNTPKKLSHAERANLVTRYIPGDATEGIPQAQVKEWVEKVYNKYLLNPEWRRVLVAWSDYLMGLIEAKVPPSTPAYWDDWGHPHYLKEVVKGKPFSYDPGPGGEHYRVNLNVGSPAELAYAANIGFRYYDATTIAKLMTPEEMYGSPQNLENYLISLGVPSILSNGGRVYSGRTPKGYYPSPGLSQVGTPNRVNIPVKKANNRGELTSSMTIPMPRRLKGKEWLSPYPFKLNEEKQNLWWAIGSEGEDDNAYNPKYAKEPDTNPGGSVNNRKFPRVPQFTKAMRSPAARASFNKTVANARAMASKAKKEADQAAWMQENGTYLWVGGAVGVLAVGGLSYYLLTKKK